MKAVSVKNPRGAITTLIFIILLTGVFWHDRYSALDHKAENVANETIVLKDKISPDASARDNSANLPVLERSWNTFLNWVYTNKKGMSFGISFGAAVLTLLSFLSIAPSRNVFLNALRGMVVGTPLGVCSNCVAPIAKGVAESGIPRATALAMMFASPTLNIIVLSMVFSTFPIQVALVKLAAALVLILLVVPLLDRNLSQKPITPPVEEFTKVTMSWFEASKVFVMSYLKNLWFIVKWTVPLMALGGFVGALAANVFDIGALAASETPVALFMLALFGTFLPVPIAFDVMLAQALMIAGAPMASVTVALTTLGAFSVFSCAIAWQTFGRSLALKLFAAVVILGTLSGLVVKLLL